MSNEQENNTNGNGLTGLANLGNTCFINSTIQCLSHTYLLKDFLTNGNYKTKLNKKPESILLIEWDKLQKMMWDEDCKISPGGFIHSVQRVANLKGKTIFTGFAQNDLHEFLIFLIDCFHVSLQREVEMNITGNVMNEKDILAKKCFEMMKRMYGKEYSEILQLFYGIQMTQITDPDDETKVLSGIPEPYFMIDLPIPEQMLPATLIDCFRLHTKTECLEGDNAWLNDKTNKKQRAMKGLTYWNFPMILVIDLKRFTNDNRKNTVYVDYPVKNLNLSEFVIGYNKDSYVYDLYGVCVHSGGVLGGHYYAYVKNKNGKWYKFNDTEVTEIDESQIVVQGAYCLFYQKK